MVILYVGNDLAKNVFAIHGGDELCVHRVRQGPVEQRTATINRIRGPLSEFGTVLAQKTGSTNATPSTTGTSC